MDSLLDINNLSFNNKTSNVLDETKEKETERPRDEPEEQLREYYKEYYQRLLSIYTKKEVIYIITNDIDVENNIFKISRTKLSNLKKKLESYNRKVIDSYYFVYYKEVFGAEEILKRFNNFMNDFNIKNNNITDKTIYQLYLPDFEFYLEKTIELDDDILEQVDKNHDTILFNSKNKESIVTPLSAEEVIQNIKDNKKIKKQETFDSLPSDEQINILRMIIDNLTGVVSRRQLEDKIKSNHNLIVNKKMPFWNLVKEITKDNDRIRITFR